MSSAVPFEGFLFDENIPEAFAEALVLVGYPVTSNKREGTCGEDDEAVIRHCASRGLVWCTKDLDARRKAAYAGLVASLGVSAVFWRAPRAKGWSAKEQFETVVRHMRPLEQRYTTARRPLFFLCLTRGQPQEARSFAARPGRK